jgi:fructose-1,6-bisphosphatase/inositol monophosphatase family enzyme
MSTFSHADLRDLARLLREAARAEVMPRFQRLSASDVRRKTGPLDLVTDADEAAERFIEAGLHGRFPGCAIVGEEAASADPAVLGRLASARLAFVVDPIDGTANYVAGLPLFATMAAAIENGAIVGAAIHDPVCQDTALALRDQGAWLEDADGRRAPLRVAAPVPVAQMTGTIAWRSLQEPERAPALSRLPRVAASWDLRCASHSYRVLAAGHCHYMLFTRLMPWDHAAGWLLHREAGGHGMRLDGTPYNPADISGGLLCAPDPASWAALRSAFFE